MGENYHACLGSVPLQGLENRHDGLYVIEADTTLFPRLLKRLQTQFATLNFVIAKHQSPACSTAIRSFELLSEG